MITDIQYIIVVGVALYGIFWSIRFLFNLREEGQLFETYRRISLAKQKRGKGVKKRQRKR